jgi:ATP-dependent Clp protease adaptor protein ClpS
LPEWASGFILLRKSAGGSVSRSGSAARFPCRQPDGKARIARRGDPATSKPAPVSGGKRMSRPHDVVRNETCTAAKDQIQEPRLFRVLLHNDNYTTMEFVVAVLMDVFHKSPEEASDIMFSVHEKGIGVCGVYPREIAEFRINMVIRRARQAGFPLLCTMEEE